MKHTEMSHLRPNAKTEQVTWVNPGFLVLASLLACPLTSSAVAQFTLDAESRDLTLDRGLVVEGVGSTTRRPINTDAVVAGLAEGSFNPADVKPGDLLNPDCVWREISAGGGSFDGIKPGSYILVSIRSAEERVMQLEANGHAMVYVNGEPRMGDPYSHGYVALPVAMRSGLNTFLFATRGTLRAALHRPKAELEVVNRDITLPDLCVGDVPPALIAVPVLNSTTAERTVTVQCDALGGEVRSGPFVLPPCSITKLPLSVRCEPGSDDKAVSVRVSVLDHERVVAAHECVLKVLPRTATHKRTFSSRVDGSTQYVSIVPPADSVDTPALVISLHGASVEATSQAGSYAAKPGYLIACPTNRRPYGFDWEDWGRIDAIEVMDLVKGWYGTDPARQYLTGHSMGGHGTWNIGVLYPDRFAAIAPSAGWLSFDSYSSAGGPPYAPATDLGKVFHAARASSMTLDFLANLSGKGIFVLHGDADDNVPVAQARAARDALASLGITFGYHEQPGAGHWWDDDKPGAACLDWPAIWETFAAAKLARGAAAPLDVPLDERGFVIGSWKRVFDHSFALVFSTGGTDEENAWSLAKARFDAEQWWYRGNGYAPVMSDDQFLASSKQRNIILYGNSQTNRAWNATVGTDKLRVQGGEMIIDDKVLKGADLACLAALPRKDNRELLVGIVAGTGKAGMRATDRLGYFSSGVGFPEVTVIRANAWKTGFDGVEGAGRIGAMVWK